MSDTKPRCVLCIHYITENDECTCKAVCKDYSEFKMTDAMANHIKESEIYDAVNPDHYKHGGIECIEALKAATTRLTGIEAVCTANAIKYLWRWKDKNGAEDIRKAIWYCERLLKEIGDEER